MTPNPQDRMRFFFRKVGYATVLGEGVFLLLLLLATFIIIPVIDAALPPEPAPMLPAPGRGTAFFFIGVIVAISVACFASGVFFSNPRNNPTLLGWPISMHGFFSGFIIGGIIPTLLLTMLSGKIHNLVWVEVGIPGAIAGFLGSAVGSGYHWLVSRRRK